MNAAVREAAAQFAVLGDLTDCEAFGNGHINDTYRVTCCDGGRIRRYILQKMNKEVFRNPEELMENVQGVTEWLKRKTREAGGDPEREVLNLIPAADHESYYVDPAGEYWRMYLFVENTSCYDLAENAEDFYQSAVAFGRFQQLLADYPAHTLHETIRDFHNTPDRFRKFRKAVEEDACGRAAGVQDEICFIMEREKFCSTLWDMQNSGALPLRVTHNDTKLNNVLIDSVTKKAVCVIDLDTVMPGLSVNDFGDSIRFGASTGAEDERDLSKISCDLGLYEAYLKGFVEGCAGALTKQEMDMLPVGAVMMTLECGIRFLTDYLEGDHYFRIHREGHNLDRARTQLKLVKDMEEKMPLMEALGKKYMSDGDHAV